MSLAIVGLTAVCTTAQASTCDLAAVKGALARTATAINKQQPQLLAKTYELFPTAEGGVAPPPYALRITRPVGKPKQNKQVSELLYAPGATGEAFLRALRHVSQLGHWSVGDGVAVGRPRGRLAGITAEFSVDRGATTLRYYGKGGIDCKTGRIFILAPLRQRARA